MGAREAGHDIGAGGAAADFRFRLDLRLYDRGLLRPGMAADIVIFDPDTVKPLPLEVLHDFPTGAKRIKEPAQGIHMTIVNGEVLLEDGKHTGALPGRVLRNTYYDANDA